MRFALPHSLRAKLSSRSSTGKCLTRISFLRTALEQARLALRTARGLRKGDDVADDDKLIFGFDELYFDHLVLSASRGQRELLASLRACRLLTRIRDYDDAHGTDNFQFLREYLRYERRTTVVAEKLHMHRNNVKYRVDRLAELFFLDTDDDDERLELSIAFRLLDSLDR